MAENDNPLIIQYTNLLNQYRDPNAPEVKAFVEQHKDDVVFVGRAKKLNKMFKLKEDLG
ncbi:MAG: hypothetical protein WCV62_03935 [Candidatus Peribacteraceae bacterium]|jgi:hypothetical protein